jgi:hypothetical protein
MAEDTNPIDTSNGPVPVVWSATSIVPNGLLAVSGTKTLGGVTTQDANLVTLGNFTNGTFQTTLNFDSSEVGAYTRIGYVRDTANGGFTVCQTNQLDVTVQ